MIVLKAKLKSIFSEVQINCMVLAGTVLVEMLEDIHSSSQNKAQAQSSTVLTAGLNSSDSPSPWSEKVKVGIDEIALPLLDTGEEPCYCTAAVMRSFRMAPPLPLLFLLMAVGASGTEWGVTYNQQEICALNGSTVFMNGSYTHPERLTVRETFLVKEPDKDKQPTDLRQDPGYSGRVGTLTDEQKHFSLRLSDVTKKDEHQYSFRIITNEGKEKWVGKPGVQLKVTDLHVEAPGEVTEGGTADLTCRTTCSLTDPTFIWYKNGRPLTTKTIKNNQLHLQTVSSEDAGSYSCAVRGYQHLRSTNQNLRVRYAPKNVSVSITPSGEIVEGRSVTLTCSSDGNPPVKTYTWFKGSTSVGNGDTYNIPNIKSEDSGEYTCQSRNEHGERRSTAVKINVQYPPKNVSVSISPSGEIVENSSVTMTCSSEGNPPVKNYTWFIGSAPVENGETYNIPNIRSEDRGEYTCQSRNEHGERRSTAVQINVQYPPKNVSVSISPSGEIVENSSVTMTCSSEGNPPVKNYTWFIGSAPVENGETYNIPNIRSEDSGEYTCQSRNEHGERRSAAVQINVQYPPKSVSVSISGEIVEGSSVTLTCSSDANPPVKNYTWFKEGGASPVGSGHSYSITSITAEHTGLYYCVAQNEHGAQNGTVMVTVKTQSLSAVWIAVGGGSSLLLLLTVFICICRTKKRSAASDPRETQQDDVLYTNVTPSGFTPVQPAASGSGAADNLYCTVGTHSDEVTSTDQQGELLYASVAFHRHTAATGSPTQNVEEASAIYSTAAVMRSFRTAPSLPLLFLLMAVGASGTEWSVKYNQQEICALEGSTVFMNGSYTLPEHLTVTETFWVIDPVEGKEPTDLSKDPGYSGRVETLTDEQKHFSLRLSDVMKKDEHEYGFRIITNEGKERWAGTPGVQLRVTVCGLYWIFRFMRQQMFSVGKRSGLQAGQFSTWTLLLCCCDGCNPPKNFSVSISPSGEIVEGSSVILTCSSDANPPVKNYTWFKEGGASPVGSGHSYSITSITAEHTGLYYCVALNEHGAQNGTVMITVKTQSLSAVWVAVGGGSSLLLLLTVFICICRTKKRSAASDPRETQQDDVPYTNVTPSGFTPVQPAASGSGADDNLYCAVGTHSDEVTSTDQQGELLYASVAFHRHTAATGSPTQNVEEASAIYSTVRKC
ncbi:hypothetical protein NFI96_007814 [Prochilodus magdalenae]|nr:hypothetical protein NFI96_007814 [Prochilodus magdalenae]